MGRKATVEVRKKSIRIRFTWRGKVRAETVKIGETPLPPGARNERRAERLADEISRRLTDGTFDEEFYREIFPHSSSLEAVIPLSLQAMAQTWLLTKSQQAPATIAQYRVATNFWIKLLGADCRIDTLQYAALASKIGGYLWPSAKTHNNYLIALRGILKLHYRGSLTMSDPSAGIENATVIKKLPDPLTRQERDMILEDMRKHCDERVYAYFLWAFSTGMRPEETIAIRWSDIDFSRKTAKVQRVRTFKGSERDGSKTHAEREIDLTDGAIEALKIMTPWTAMLHVKRVGDDDTNHDIFQNPVTRRAWHDERSQRDHYWRPTLKRLGIRWRRAYNTRHTFATLALMGDVKPAYIAAQLGHSVKVLLEKYARWISSNDTGSEKARLNASMGNLYPECTQEIC